MWTSENNWYKWFYDDDIFGRQLNNKKLQLILKTKLPDWKVGVNQFIKQI
jgi:hypothetical protein